MGKQNTIYTYKYPHPAVTVDCVVFGYDGTDLKVLLIERNLAPFKGQWALPGGFVRMEESVEEAAYRELQEETGLHNLFLEQLYTFGAPDRDPRERVISIAYYTLVSLAGHALHPSTDAAKAEWFPVSNLPQLAFDHQNIIECAHQRLRGKIRYEPVGFELLPPTFPLSLLQRLYEIILGRQLDKRNFLKKLKGMDLVKDTGEKQQGVAHRAARLYRFDEAAYQRLTKAGFNFEL